MTTFVVHAVRVREGDGWITDLRVQAADVATRAPVGPVLEVPSHEVSDSVLAGNAHFPVFLENGSRVIGPRLRYLARSGDESVQDAENCPEGRSLMDLPRF